MTAGAPAGRSAVHPRAAARNRKRRVPLRAAARKTAVPSGAGCSGDPGAGGCSESEERQAFLTGSMRAEGEGTIESTQEKMEGNLFFWKEKEDSGCRHIRKQQEEYRETVASGAFRGIGADHLWALGRAYDRLFCPKTGKRTAICSTAGREGPGVRRARTNEIKTTEKCKRKFARNCIQFFVRCYKLAKPQVFLRKEA